MKTAFDEVLDVRGLERPEAGQISITGQDPVLTTRYKIGETCAAVLGGVGLRSRISGNSRPAGARTLQSMHGARRQRSELLLPDAAA